MRNILMIHTGGTISMEPNSDGSLTSKSIADSVNYTVSELNKLANITHVQLFSIDSSQITIEQTQLIAQTLFDNRDNYDGFVIIHGTDTMAYTASALSFMFRNFNKPIVLTGAQRPLSEPRTDARINLIDAVTIACYKHLNEIMIVFNSTVFRGCRVTKHKINEYDAFLSLNIPPIAILGVNVEFQKFTHFKPGTFKYFPELNPNIAVFKVFPGVAFENYEFAKTPDAIILDAYGAGNLLPSQNLIKYIKKHESIPVIIHSQAPIGKVNLNLYEAGTILKKLGAIGSANISFEALIFKTMHLLSYSKTKYQFIKAMSKDLIGEIDY